MHKLSSILRHLEITGKSASEGVTFADLTQLADDDREGANNDEREKLIAEQHAAAQGAVKAANPSTAGVQEIDYDKLAAALGRRDREGVPPSTLPPFTPAVASPGGSV